MSMKRGTADVFLFFILLGTLSAVSFPDRSPGPRLWSIRVELKVKGGYTYDGPRRTYKGDFLYNAAWNGVLEKDGDDFILFHDRLEPLAWEIEEKDPDCENSPPLETENLPRRPEFRMIYVLGEDKHLRLYFTVDGFRVPLRDSDEKFDLILPCSLKDAQDPSDYRDSLIKGCNDVSFARSSIRKGPFHKAFQWTWKRYLPPAEKGLVRSQFHEVEVLVSIAPR